MVYRIVGGIAITLLGLHTMGLMPIPTIIIGVLLTIGGLALLAGV